MKIIRKAAKAFYNAPTQMGGQSSGCNGDDELTIERHRSLMTHNPGPDQIVLDADDSQRKLAAVARSSIDEREASKILKLRYGLEGEDPMTLKEIGARIGLTRERVRQIEHEALGRLRDTMMAKA